MRREGLYIGNPLTRRKLINLSNLSSAEELAIMLDPNGVNGDGFMYNFVKYEVVGSNGFKEKDIFECYKTDPDIIVRAARRIWANYQKHREYHAALDRVVRRELEASKRADEKEEK